MKNLSINVLLITIIYVALFLIPNSVNAQVPGLNLSCSETDDPEFHSLRPYQAAPCGDSVKARFCSNRLVFFESFDVTGRNDCKERGIPGDFICSPDFQVLPHDLHIELDAAQFPILGNTEDVKNYQNESDSIDDAVKVNEYASWYLGGVTDKAENKESTDEQIVNFSGPVKKLLPSVIQDSQRIKTIETATTITTYEDEDTGEDTEEPENHDQIVVDEERLSSWTGDLSYLRSLTNSATDLVNGIVGGATGGLIQLGLDSVGIDLQVNSGWNKRTPPLPWDDGTGKPFKSNELYLKAYNEWKGKTCVTLPVFGLQCIDNPLITNKYADLWRFVPLSNNTDKKGANYLVTYDGPSYDPSESAGTEIVDAFHESYTNAPLYFAHTQEVKDLSELLNKTYTAQGLETKPVPSSTESKKLPLTLSPDKQYPVDPECSAVNVRTNKGDDLFPGDGPELTATGVQYKITKAKCEETTKEDKCCPKGVTDCLPSQKTSCTSSTVKCIAEVGVVFELGTKTPWANEIFQSTVAGSNATFRKIFPKVEKGAPVSCIADIPAVTSVTYDPSQSQKPKGGDYDFKAQKYPQDSAGDGTELTFPHIGSVYEYFLKGIQTALRPKGYGEPIADGGLLCYPRAEDSCDIAVPDSSVPSKYLGGFKDNFISLADRWSEKCPGPENNMASECYNFVASIAQKEGINPAFALTIWLNESGASNYCEGGETTQDMGINLPNIYLNLPEQIKVFVNMAKTKLCSDSSGFDEPMHGWLSRFQSSDGICDPSDEIATQYYHDVMETTWSWVSGCSNGDKFGIDWPTDMSCP